LDIPLVYRISSGVAILRENSMQDLDLEGQALSLGAVLGRFGLKLVTAESCTGGWLSTVLTSIPGSSVWFDRGFVTYSNEAKEEVLGVGGALIEQFGAVSRETAEAMALGALLHSHSDISIAVTGVAGPGGGTLEKPVGTVWFGCAFRGAGVQSGVWHFKGGRSEVRRQAVAVALQILKERLRQHEA
jgi:nicotinamide-nucleotide amidase